MKTFNLKFRGKILNAAPLTAQQAEAFKQKCINLYSFTPSIKKI